MLCEVSSCAFRISILLNASIQRFCPGTAISSWTYLIFATWLSHQFELEVDDVEGDDGDLGEGDADDTDNAGSDVGAPRTFPRCSSSLSTAFTSASASSFMLASVLRALMEGAWRVTSGVLRLSTGG